MTNPTYDVGDALRSPMMRAGGLDLGREGRLENKYPRLDSSSACSIDPYGYVL